MWLIMSVLHPLLASPEIDSWKTLDGNSNNNDLIKAIIGLWSSPPRGLLTPGLSHLWNSWNPPPCCTSLTCHFNWSIVVKPWKTPPSSCLHPQHHTDQEQQLSENFPFLISVIKATNINSKLRDFKHFFWKQNMQHLIS